MRFKAGRYKAFYLPADFKEWCHVINENKTKEKVKEPRTKITWKEVKRQKVLLFWAAIMVAYGVVFYYLPLAGWAMAFQEL